MAIEVGSVLNGTVSGITKFGAFIDLGDKQTGLVHISEVAHGYVQDITDVLTVQDAAWSYNNITTVTIVEFYKDSNPGPL